MFPVFIEMAVSAQQGVTVFYTLPNNQSVEGIFVFG
jgi:hypothetical protein